MNYNVIITERANQQLDNIIHYIVYKLKNKQAAASVLDDVLKAYNKLESVAGALALCEDPYLSGKGYRKLALDKHDYILLYQIEENTVYVNGIFHMLENYRDKL